MVERAAASGDDSGGLDGGRSGRDGGEDGSDERAGHSRSDGPGDRDEQAGRDAQGGRDERRAGRNRHRRKERSFWREFPVLVVVALGLALLIKTFLMQAFYIPSGSMENTLLRDDRVLVNKLAYRLGEVERGDVIVFNGEGSWQPEGAPGDAKDYIKRVIGVPGDTVKCCDPVGRLTINGRPVIEPYLHPGDKPSRRPFSIKVPPDRLWVMGDHRSASADSRAHRSDPGTGTVPMDSVVGRAFVVIWPPDRIRLLSPPPTLEEAGPALGAGRRGSGLIGPRRAVTSSPQ